MIPKYLPEQLKKHPDFIDRQDAIAVILDPNKFYTLAEADYELNKELSREVD